jgi:hypothetical protein
VTKGRLDVHAHFVPDGYRAAAEAAGHAQPDGFPALPDWDPARHLEMMDRLGIAAALLSISSPGLHFGDDAAARALAREVNEVGHRTVGDHPTRFGHLGSLPPPGGRRDEVDGADVSGVGAPARVPSADARARSRPPAARTE